MNSRPCRVLVSLATVVFLTGCGGGSVNPPAVVSIPIGEEPPSADAPINRARMHTVRQGETLGEIALHYGLSYTDLALWNNIPNPDLIEVGDRLQLYPPANQPQITTVRKQAVVKPVPTTQADAGKVTRTRVNVGSTKQQKVTGLVSEPVALKIDYSDAEYERLLSIARGGAQQASLKVRTDTDTLTPRNVNSLNGINWSWPVNGKLIAKFSEANRGIDIGGPRGQPIFAAADGKVIYAGSGLKGYGQLVIIKHANEYLSTYAHNDTISVAEGQEVTRGTKIAEMGDSGTDRIGLHFGIRRGEQAYDPAKFLPKSP